MDMHLKHCKANQPHNDPTNITPHIMYPFAYFVFDE